MHLRLILKTASTVCTLVLVCALLWVGTTNARENRFQGSGVPDPYEIPIDMQGARFAVVTASQKSARYQLSLIKEDSESPVKTVNADTHKALPEMMLIDAADCQPCSVRLEGTTPIDRRSPYSLSVEYFANAEADLLISSGAYGVIKAISEAGEIQYRVALPSATDLEKNYRAAIAELELAVLNTQHEKWVTHAKLLTMQLYGSLRDTDKVIQIAREIVMQSRGRISIYAIQAKYELGRRAYDFVEKNQWYRDGMADAKAIGEPVIYAKGANYLAISYTREARFEEALVLFKEVYDIYSESQSFSVLLFPLSNLSWASRRAGRLPDAISYAAQQKLLADEYSEVDSVIWALYNMALAYSAAGDWFEAERFLDEAFEKYSALSATQKKFTGIIYGYLLQARAENLLRLGDFPSAQDYAKQTMAFYEEGGYLNSLPEASFLEAQIAVALDQPETARTLFKQAIELDRSNNRESAAGRNLLRFAQFEMTQGNMLAASKYQVAAMKSMTGSQDHHRNAQALSQAVELLTSLKSFDKAEHLAMRASAYIAEFGRGDDHALFAFRRALLEYHRGDLKQSLTYLNSAIETIESLLPKVHRRDLRRHYFALQKSIYDLNVEILISLGETDMALRLVESYKARTLTEALSESSNADAENVELKRTREILLNKILDSAATWYGETGRGDVSLLKNTRAISAALAKVETNMSDVRNSKKFRAREHRLPEIPKVLNSQELMLYFFVGQRSSAVWQVNAEGLSVHTLPAGAELESLIERVTLQVGISPNRRKDTRAWELRRDIETLSNILLTPVLEELTSNRYRFLTIIPDGPLHELPFSILKSSDMTSPLVEKVAIAYSYSNESRKMLTDRAKNQDRVNDVAALVIADPVNVTGSGPPIVKLSSSVQEASHIKRLFNARAKTLVGEQAVKDLFLAELPNNYSILHFATHGLLNGVEPSLSGLVFSKVSKSPNFWLLPEISAAKISSNLVFLSACESSIGQQVVGEGLMSLSRAFLEGGASNVIGTLWKVQDTSTAMLTTHFYSYLLDDSLTISEALQAAQIAVYSNEDNDWRDPYYWAGFQLQGGWHTLTYGSRKDSH